MFTHGGIAGLRVGLEADGHQESLVPVTFTVLDLVDGLAERRRRHGFLTVLDPSWERIPTRDG